MDDSEAVRRAMVEEINSSPGDRAELEARYGQVWDTSELGRDFEVVSFAAPLVIARNKATGEVGSLFFQHMPRFYWGWKAD
jgi:hypothetical protein